MSRPRINLENYAEVYNYYKGYRPTPVASWTLHAALGAVFAPQVAYAPGAKKQIADLLHNHKSVVLAANHTKAIDPCLIAALPVRQHAFRPLIGNTFIPSKKSIFKNPLVRRAVDGLGAVPVFRQKDTELEQDTSSNLPRASLTAFVKTSVARLIDRQNMAIYPVGARKKGDDTKCHELPDGIDLMVGRVSRVPEPPVYPLGGLSG